MEHGSDDDVANVARQCRLGSLIRAVGIDVLQLTDPNAVPLDDLDMCRKKHVVPEDGRRQCRSVEQLANPHRVVCRQLLREPRDILNLLTETAFRPIELKERLGCLKPYETKALYFRWVTEHGDVQRQRARHFLSERMSV